ncbi:MAG: hypothetical protein CVU86_00305 [Firmicutes bacterium HGW-Firmicutes-11]|jgi:hypothetical protein|nr:MAG: hypothetical protein CVU86_00305 [Firmicutes bacterium HGW-Firmicutes-11]
MTHSVISFDIDSAEPIARNFFLKYSGIETVTTKKVRMMERAELVLDQIRGSLNLKAVCLQGIPDRFEGTELVFLGQNFRCQAFDGIEKDTLRSVYAYALTTGAFTTGSEQILDQLYEDIWGTAFVDACRGLLREQLESGETEKDPDVKLSQSFGPGYYGMEVGQTRLLGELLPLDEIGMKINESGMMIPQKSCTGLLFMVPKESPLPSSACVECGINTAGCRFCDGFFGTPSA